jgi:hypothetical protein
MTQPMFCACIFPANSIINYTLDVLEAIGDWAGLPTGLWELKF